MKNKKMLIAFLSPLLMVAVFFASKWIIEGAYYTGDLVINTVPLENLHRIIQRSGQSPLWAPELAGGYPLLATGQLGYWYPLHMILRQFLPGVWNLNVSLLMHALLAAAGTFFFLRYNGIRSISAGIGAVILPLGSTVVGKYGSLNLILPFMWVPLLLFVLQCCFEKKSKIYVLIWTGINVMCILVGHPQMALYVLILQLVFTLFLSLYHRSRWRRMLSIISGMLLAVGITSFYWLPILDNLPETDRASGTLVPNEQGLFDNQFIPKAFWNFVIPHPFGHGKEYYGPTNESELASYFGPGMLVLAALGLYAGYKKSRLLWVFSLLLIGVGMSLAIGGYSPVFLWLVHHGFTYFNAPARFFLYAYIGIMFLAVLGIESALSYFQAVRQRILVLICITLFALVPYFWVSWSWHRGIPWEFTDTPSIVKELERERGVFRVVSAERISGIAPNDNFGIKQWNPVCQSCMYRQTFHSSFEHSNGISIMFSNPVPSKGIITLRLYEGGHKIRETNVSAEAIIDSQWTLFSFERVADLTKKEMYIEISSNMERHIAPRTLIYTNPSEQYHPDGRLYNCTSGTCEHVSNADLAFTIHRDSSAIPQHEALAPYVSAGYGIGSMQWYGSLPLQYVKTFNSPIGTWGDAFGDGARSMINRFSVSHLIGIFPPYRFAYGTEGISLVSSVSFADRFVRIYRNSQAFPRLHFVERVRSIQDTADQINVIRKEDPVDQAVVVANIDRDLLFRVAGNTSEIVTDTRTRVVIKTEQESEGFLVLRDNFLKGWNATLDTVPTRMYRVDGVFRGLIVPAGIHTVTFTYQPEWLKHAAILSGSSIFIFLLLIIYSVRCRD